MSKEEEEFSIEDIFKDFPDDDDEMFKEEIEVDAPNSVIEAMIKAEMHKNKKIKFVRRKK